MRRTLPDQLDLVPAFHTHVRSRELEAMSAILDAHPEAARWVLRDLVGQRSSSKGREGMSGEQVLRVMLVKQLGTFSYEELAFHLADSASYRTFCRIGSMQKLPTSKTIQRNVKKVEPLTLERINVLLIEHAIGAEIEDGNKLRVDCTVVETNIHAPSDSSLLVDSVRVLVRIMDRAQEYVDAPFTNHHRRAKRRAIGILHARRQEDRVPLYLDLLKVTNKTVTAADRVIAAFTSKYSPQALTHPLIFEIFDSLRHYLELARRVVTQAHRRVVLGETVPSSEKLVSIFETHTDIIVKDRRDTLYGHKLCLATGASGLITDCHVGRAIRRTPRSPSAWSNATWNGTGTRHSRSASTAPSHRAPTSMRSSGSKLATWCSPKARPSPSKRWQATNGRFECSVGFARASKQRSPSSSGASAGLAARGDRCDRSRRTRGRPS